MFKDRIKEAVDKFYKDYQKAGDELHYLQMTKYEYRNAEMQDPIISLTNFLNDVLIKEINERIGKRFLIVEDGSVDTDNLIEEMENNNIKVIVYRQGANKPEFLSKGDEK